MNKRIYVDLDAEVHKFLEDMAHEIRVSMKRYLESLIEKDFKAKGGKVPAKKKA